MSIIGTIIAGLIVGLLAAGAPAALPYAAPYVAGLVLAIPFARWTATPALGRWMAAHKLCGTPEEFAPV